MKRIYLLLVFIPLFATGCWLFYKKPEAPPPPTPWEESGLSDLKDRLYSEDPENRALAADYLIVRGDKRAIRTLSDALRTAPEQVVSSILKVLAMRPEEKLILPLIDVLEKRNPAFHNFIFEVFRHFERENLTAVLLDRIREKDKTLEARQRLILGLGKASSKKAVEPLISLLGNEENDMDNEINNALNEITQQRFSAKNEWLEWWTRYKDKPREIWLDEAVNNYQRILKDKNTQIETLVTTVVNLKINLLNIKLEEAKKLPQSDGVISILLATLNDDYWQVKKYALEQLRTLPKDKLKEILPKLIELTKSPEEEFRNSVVITLGEIGDESVISPTLVALLENQKESVSVRKNAASAMGRIGSPSGIGPLTGILKENSNPLLLSVIEALGKIKSTSSIPSLLACLEDKGKPAEIHRAIIDALGEIKDPATVEGLIKFVDDPRDRFRWSAANSLGKIGAETAIPSLIKLLDDSFADIRQISVESLGNIGKETAVSPLAKTLINDKDPRVRELSAAALGKIKNKQSIPTLLNALKDANERVIQSAWNSILVIINNDLNLMAETAKELEQAKDLSRAVELYKKIVETSDEPQYIKSLIGCLKGLAKTDDVVKYYGILLAKQVKNSSAWWELRIELVDYLYDKKEYAKTLVEIKELIGYTSISPAVKERLEKLKAECEKATTP